MGIYIYSAWDSRNQALEREKADVTRTLSRLAAAHEGMMAATRQILMTFSRLPDVQNLNTAATNKILRELLKHNPLYGNIFILNAEGMFISSAEPFTPQSLKERKYFQDVLRTMDFSAGEYVVGAAIKRPVFHLAYPISDGRGRFKGVVGVALDIARYGNLFSMAKLPEGSTFSMTDHKGTVLYHFPAPEKYIGKADTPEMIKNMSSSSEEGLFVAFGVDGIKRFYAYRRFHLKKDDPTYLYMRVGIQEETVLSSSKKSLMISGILFCFALLIAILSSWFISKVVIVKRLERLVNATHKLAQGELTTRAGLSYEKDELGELARSFDVMAERLEEKEHERRLAEEEERRNREETERLAGEMAIMAEIGRLISSTLDIEEVYDRFAAETRKLIPFDSLIVNLKKPREDTLDVAYASGADIPERRKGGSFPLKGSVSEVAMRTRTGLIVRSADILKKTDRFSTLGVNLQAGLLSMMGAPLISRDEAIGALVFRAEKQNAYTEQDLRLAERIGAQIAGAIANAQLFADRKRMEEEILEMSFRDQMTELYNRRGFITLAGQQIKAANRAKRPMRLTFVDCDGLKWINDTLGHEEGDRALIDTANVLRQTFRESDIIARLGGDEFAVLSIDATDMNPEDFSKRLQQNIDAGNAQEARPYKLAISWGTAVYDPESPISLDELMSSADELMYAQKKAKSKNGK